MDDFVINVLAGLVVALVTGLVGSGLRAGGSNWRTVAPPTPVASLGDGQVIIANGPVHQSIDQRHTRVVNTTTINVSNGSSQVQDSESWVKPVGLLIGLILAAGIYILFWEYAFVLSVGAVIGTMGAVVMRVRFSLDAVGGVPLPARVVVAETLGACVTACVAWVAALTLNQEGHSIVSIRADLEEVAAEAGFIEGIGARISAFVDLGRGSIEVGVCAMVATALAWVVLGMTIGDLRTWAMYDESLTRAPTTDRLGSRLEAFESFRYTRLGLLAVMAGLVWSMGTGAVLDLLHWLQEPGFGT